MQESFFWPSFYRNWLGVVNKLAPSLAGSEQWVSGGPRSDSASPPLSIIKPQATASRLLSSDYGLETRLRSPPAGSEHSLTSSPQDYRPLHILDLSCVPISPNISVSSPISENPVSVYRWRVFSTQSSEDTQTNHNSHD